MTKSQLEEQSHLHPWDLPAYSATAAGRLVGLTPGRVKRWLCGYEFTYTVGSNPKQRRVRMDAVVRRSDGDDSPFASFLDLVDLLFVRRFLDHDISLQKLRKSLEEAETLLGGHHFAQRSFFTEGHNIYVQVHEKAEALLQLLSGGQWVIAPIIKALAKQIEFHDATGFAERWYPLGRRGLVVLDPRISFGSPTIVSRSVETANVYDLFRGEGDDVETVSQWMNITALEVEAAVRFEHGLRAA